MRCHNEGWTMNETSQSIIGIGEEHERVNHITPDASGSGTQVAVPATGPNANDEGIHGQVCLHASALLSVGLPALARPSQCASPTVRSGLGQAPHIVAVLPHAEGLGLQNHRTHRPFGQICSSSRSGVTLAAEGASVCSEKLAQ